MTEFFDWFSDFCEMLYQFFNSLGQIINGIFIALGELYNILNNVLTLAVDSISTLPDWLTLYATTTVLVCLLYLIVGREGGK